MQLRRIIDYLKNHQIIVLVLVIAIGLPYQYLVRYAIPIHKAEQNPNIIEMKENLEKGLSFRVKTEGWAEKKAMESVLSDYNRENNYTREDNKYQIYNLIEGSYWITSENIHRGEFAMMAANYYGYLGDMICISQSESKKFVFEYMDYYYEMVLDNIIADSELVKQYGVTIQEERRVAGDVTFAVITVSK